MAAATDSEQVKLTLPAELVARLRSLAAQRAISLSALCRVILSQEAAKL